MSAVLSEVQGVEAMRVLPEGQRICAPTPPKTRRGAIKSMPKGQRKFAPDAPIQECSGEARVIVPKGHVRYASPNPNEDVEANHRLPKGHDQRASHPPQTASESATSVLPKGQGKSADHSHTIASLRELHRQRQDFHRAEKSLTLQAKAICRRLCAGDKDEANKLYAAMEKGADDAQAEMARMLTEPFIQARSILEGNRKRTEKAMEKSAKTLPVAQWVDGIKGFGIASLAAVIGEAGDLSNYPTHSHLWKRLGLAVIDGGRQRLMPGADAIIHGYCPSRRSVVWNVGQCVFKAQSQRVDKETGEVKKEAGEYRKLYDARKEYELPRVEGKKAHAHNRAMRYMEKKLMRDLWKAWRAV